MNETVTPEQLREEMARPMHDWTRHLLGAAAARIDELEEALEAAYEYLNHFVPVGEAEINGFDVVTWCNEYEALAGPRSDATESEA